VDVTAHLRARAVQAGAFLALAGGMLAVAAAPAQAAPPLVQITTLSSGDLQSGQTATMTYAVTNRNVPPNTDTSFQVVVSGDGVTCSKQCNLITTINPGETKTFDATLLAGAVDDGRTRVAHVVITATSGDTSGTARRDITVHGAAKAEQVRQISGRVKDQNGKALPGAVVGIRDSQGHGYQAETNKDGGYQFTSSDQAPITPGPVTVGATKDGYKQSIVTVQAQAGRTVTVPLTLAATTAATAAATPSAEASIPAAPSAGATDTAGIESAAAAPTAPAASSTKDSSSSLLFLIIGGLLVAAGVGAIVLVLMRRRSHRAVPLPDGLAAAPAGRYAASAGATRVAPRVPAATMLATRPGAPSIADAPTMLHQPVPADDEFPDPYGAPASPPGAYGAATSPAPAGAYGATAVGGAFGAARPPDGPAGTYGGPRSYGRPAPPQGGPVQGGPVQGGPVQGGPVQRGPVQRGPVQGGPVQGAAAPAPGGPAYGAPRRGGRGYGDDEPRYDEPTGMYRPEQGYERSPEPGTGGYRAPGGGYPSEGHQQPDRGGYGAEAEPADTRGYAWGAPGGGVDSGNAYGGYGTGGGYGSTGRDGGTYGGQQGGYDGGRGTYGRTDPYDGGGADGAGYDEGGYYDGERGSGGRHGAAPRQQPPEPGQPRQRRPLDWLDD
jgi:Carboxypeptidase regulatory-like domain